MCNSNRTFSRFDASNLLQKKLEDDERLATVVEMELPQQLSVEEVV